MERIEIRPARSDESRAVADCGNAAYEHYITRIGKKPAPMLADYPALIAEGLVSVIPTKAGVRGVIALMTATLRGEPTSAAPRRYGGAACGGVRRTPQHLERFLVAQ